MSSPLALVLVSITVLIFSDSLCAQSLVIADGLLEHTTGPTVLGSSLTVRSNARFEGSLRLANDPLDLVDGGTNKSLSAVSGGMLWTDSDSMEVLSGGTSGQVLITGGVGTPFFQTGANLKVLYDVTQVSSVSAYDMTGLALTKNKRYYLRIDGIQGQLGAPQWLLYVNGDYTNSNYTQSRLTQDDDTVSGIREQAPYYGFSESLGEGISMEAMLTVDAAGYFRWFARCNFSAVVEVAQLMTAGGKNSPVTTVTSIRIATSDANSIGIGSVITLYEVE